MVDAFFSFLFFCLFLVCRSICPALEKDRWISPFRSLSTRGGAVLVDVATERRGFVVVNVMWRGQFVD